MKKFKSNYFILFFFISISSTVFSQAIHQKCASAEIEKRKLESNPNYAKNRMAFMQSISNFIVKNNANNARKSSISELLRIPIVVHVIHNNTTNTIGGRQNPNITDDQIKSQIDVLNEDYRKKANTLGFNSNPLGADMNIEFFLAETDPQGNASNGITRNFTSRQSFDPFSDTDQQFLSNISYWPSDCYLNIWTTTLANNYLGFSQFPSAPNFDGLDADGDEKVDGVFIDYRYFGRNSSGITSKYYNKGRTTTHEIGHWFGLIHTWGDEDCGNDYVADTPTTQGPNLTVVCIDKFSTCTGKSTRNMIENYLDYTIDSCMNIFTKGQLERVNAVLELSPRRKKIVECARQLPESDQLNLQIIPNPVVDQVKGTILLKGKADVKVAIFDLRGNEIDNKVFLNKKSFIFSLPLYNLVSGEYLIVVNALGQTTFKRILINGN